MHDADRALDVNAVQNGHVDMQPTRTAKRFSRHYIGDAGARGEANHATRVLQEGEDEAEKLVISS